MLHKINWFKAMFKYAYLIILSTIMCSCFSNRNLIYFQDKAYTEKEPTLVERKKIEYRVQPFDVLSIKVHGPDAISTEFLNMNSTDNAGRGTNIPILYLNGYNVNEKGNIEIPTIGELQVKNMTLSEVENMIQSTVDQYLNNATVSVKLVSFKVSVLGEVNNPGQHYIFNGQANILEALALSGDLTRNGNRRNVKLIRQTPEGSQVVLLDLTDPNLIESEFFNMQPNDVLYIEPAKAHTRRINLELMSLVFSGITTVVLLVNTFTR
jgi:polysaccharide biosynthesis/export protein